jgi:DNA-directed RNA polymerase subunit RPC12/RpoP
MRTVDRCSRCGKEFNNLQIEILLETRTSRVKENGLWEPLPNLSVKSREVLCKECFDIFAIGINENMNKKEGNK